MKLLHRFWRDERGATAIEYVLVASLISCAIFVSLQLIGPRTTTRYMAVANNLT